MPRCSHRPTVPIVLPLVREYCAMRGNEAGSSLHIMLDDGNCDDASAAWCVGYARECGDGPGERLAIILSWMSTTQRRKLARLRWRG